ncbi:GNAT family N-acetyltransferase [Paraconexibacter sp.]|uniref:GNAT family N-acetyltransferase n=1 Tax=Paraconexibacter sp. TaxID=2949640 RepID=UPI003568DD75
MSLPSVAIFNDPRYHALHAPSGARSLVLSHHEGDRLVGSLAGVVHENRFTSGFSAPFGGVDLERPDETPARICALVDDVVGQLRDQDVDEALVRCRPGCHGAGEDAVRFALLNAGFAVREADLSFTLDLAGLSDASDWLAQRKREFRRAVRQADPSAFAFGAARDWPHAFGILEANRAARGRSLSIDLDRVLAVRDAFGDAVRLAELRHDDVPVAAALTYRASPTAELVVAWGDAGHDLPRSPMPVLVLRLVERAIAEGLRALDLGTSTLPDPSGRRVPNDGLVQFKRILGARAELRPVLARSFA